ncbi:helix-turn-helix transcriptional regulator [uncultured Eubacterium sp.]|uniref:helix-turn-helix domain-containing protein n=1 Tax=uncultured Eubacterium sp. TaxID=165185 RepID=UPI0015AC828B|nr:helix-turn-helix transcriptional regulator [uncultured Eubacterium sp.]
MADALEKIRQKFNIDNAVKGCGITAVALMSLFTYAFLGTEFLFVNLVSSVVSDTKSVVAQNCALGISALGFFIYPLLCRFFKSRGQASVLIGATAVLMVCLFVACRQYSYLITLVSGLLMFLALGLLGSATHFKCLCLFEKNTHIARLVGISYMLGTLLQVAVNNLIHTDMSEAVVLCIFIVVLTFLLVGAKTDTAVTSLKDISAADGNKLNDGLGICLLLVSFVGLMTCIFSTLDNAVTLYHANGTVNIGQAPRILLALSGLLAGFLFDIADRKLMSVIMYCVMILSTACLVVLQFAGPFMIGLIIFYLSAGFFAVFFTSSFMEMARYTKSPELWAGLGRAINNIVAVIITGGSLALLDSGNNIAIITIELLLFVLTSVAALAYTNKRKAFFDGIEAEAENSISESERLEKIAEKFSLTPRETEVLNRLVNTEDALQVIADSLYISKRTLERHISSIYEKTGVKSRIALISIYMNA